MMERLRGWRTVLVNAVAMTPAVIEAAMVVLSMPEWQGIIPAGYWPLYVFALALLNLILRRDTRTRLGSRE